MTSVESFETDPPGHKPELWQNPQVRSSSLSWVLIGLGFILGASNLTLYSNIFFALSTIAGAFYFSREAIDHLFKDKEIGIDFLMTAAILGACLLGQWREAALVAALFSISEALEGYTIQKTRFAVRNLMKLVPQMARVIKNGSETETEVEKIQVGEIIRVRPGESIPVDGLIEEGNSSINEASVTGESIPVDKSSGEEVFAGTLNGNGSIIVKTTKEFKENTVNKIIDLVEKAQSQKGKSQQFVERFGKVYSPAVLIIALLIAIAAFLFGGDAKQDWIRKAITFLVAASPCALAVATPVTMIAAIGGAAKRGVLIKGGIILEGLGKVKAIAIDKTGTLTIGKPSVVSVYTQNISEDELIRLAASVEFLSEHPLAKAVVNYANSKKLEFYEVNNFLALTSVGAKAEIGGNTIFVIKPKAAEQFLHKASNELKSWEANAQAQGNTVISVSRNSEVIGLIALADTIRDEARTLISSIKKVGIKHIVMLTGDNVGSAKAISNLIGITEFHAALLPEDKVTKVNNLREKYGEVAMVGDGINDAPALASATVGIAMGTGGSDAALAIADVALIKNDLLRLAYSVKLGATTRRVIKQNIFLSLAIVAILVAATFSNSMSMFSAVIGHEGSEVLIILNGLRVAWQR